MDGGRANSGFSAEKDAVSPSELPAEVRRVAPAAAAPTPSAFANVQLRPDGQRYGDADLRPGGSLEGSGGMLMNERNFPGSVVGGRGDLYEQPGVGAASDYARFDPMFPGQLRPGRGGGGRGGFGVGAPRMPGEPDDDNFFPPGGRPGEAFGGPGGGQFGPGQGGFGGMGRSSW